jgi:hypothetical protein
MSKLFVKSIKTEINAQLDNIHSEIFNNNWCIRQHRRFSLHFFKILSHPVLILTIWPLSFNAPLTFCLYNNASKSQTLHELSYEGLHELATLPGNSSRWNTHISGYGVPPHFKRKRKVLRAYINKHPIIATWKFKKISPKGHKL